MHRADQLIAKLELAPHPEGGFYREMYRSSETIKKDALPARYTGARSFSTGIYFLLRGHDFSAFHRLHSDEMWHFYEGSPVAIYHIAGQKLVKAVLGTQNDAVPQYIIPAGQWFAAEVLDKESYSLVGCTVAPGFDFADFELAERAKLISSFPHLREDITRLTRV